MQGVLDMKPHGGSATSAGLSCGRDILMTTDHRPATPTGELQ